MKRIENLFKAIGLLICGIFINFPFENYTVQLTLFAFILLSVGIPHGAIDHVISNQKMDRSGLVKFLGVYLLLISAYLMCWYFFPVLSLVAFLIMSSYHFGQSHFLEKSAAKRSSWILYISRGGFFLAVILLGDWDATKLILSSLIDLTYLDPFRLIILVSILILTLLAQLISGPKFNSYLLLELVILGPILYFSPLLIGFIVYFGFWHALPSMMVEYKFLRTFKEYDSIKKFSYQLIPFSVISYLGIGLILAVGVRFLDESELILVFFVLISLISFPHILFMDRFLKNQN